MHHRSNVAEVLYPEPPDPPPARGLQPNLLPPPGLTQPLWRSLTSQLRDRFAPEQLPPLLLTSRPVNVGLLLGDRLSLPWYRTVFTNLGDVISPEVLPPLELESRPVDVGELITDQLSHYWWASLLRNLADRVAPEKLPPLELTAKPLSDMIPRSWLMLPLWSEVISTPKVFYPDKPADQPPAQVVLRPIAVKSVEHDGPPADPRPVELLRDIRRSRIRERIWIAVAAVQVAYFIVATFWPGLL